MIKDQICDNQNSLMITDMMMMMMLHSHFIMDDQSSLWWCRNGSKTLLQRFSLTNKYWKKNLLFKLGMQAIKKNIERKICNLSKACKPKFVYHHISRYTCSNKRSKFLKIFFVKYRIVFFERETGMQAKKWKN